MTSPRLLPTLLAVLDKADDAQALLDGAADLTCPDFLL